MLYNRGDKLRLLVDKSRHGINDNVIEPHRAGDILTIYMDCGGWPKRVNVFSQVSPNLSEIVYLWDGEYEVVDNDRVL